MAGQKPGYWKALESISLLPATRPNKTKDHLFFYPIKYGKTVLTVKKPCFKFTFGVF
jgi:hypothetical protein